jgi:hypothetical protein
MFTIGHNEKGVFSMLKHAGKKKKKKVIRSDTQKPTNPFQKAPFILPQKKNTTHKSQVRCP